jgi:hypothetical protein
MGRNKRSRLGHGSRVHGFRAPLCRARNERYVRITYTRSRIEIVWYRGPLAPDEPAIIIKVFDVGRVFYASDGSDAIRARIRLLAREHRLMRVRWP